MRARADLARWRTWRRPHRGRHPTSLSSWASLGRVRQRSPVGLAESMTDLRRGRLLPSRGQRREDARRHPLTDEDRWPWLRLIGEWMSEQEKAGISSGRHVLRVASRIPRPAPRGPPGGPVLSHDPAGGRYRRPPERTARGTTCRRRSCRASRPPSSRSKPTSPASPSPGQGQPDGSARPRAPRPGPHAARLTPTHGRRPVHRRAVLGANASAPAQAGSRYRSSSRLHEPVGDERVEAAQPLLLRPATPAPVRRCSPNRGGRSTARSAPRAWRSVPLRLSAANRTRVRRSAERFHAQRSATGHSCIAVTGR